MEQKKKEGFSLMPPESYVDRTMFDESNLTIPRPQKYMKLKPKGGSGTRQYFCCNAESDEI